MNGFWSNSALRQLFDSSLLPSIGKVSICRERPTYRVLQHHVCYNISLSLPPLACKRKEQDHGHCKVGGDRGGSGGSSDGNHSGSNHSGNGGHSKKPRLVFTDVQRRTLHAIFKENKRPSKELQITISQQLGLELTTVSNFFMNARRRSLDKWLDDNGGSTHSANSSVSTCSKA
uniref:hepatocyte nuclear factor 6-like n=1 Tax=Oncorhynchus gorbuscha TaxID=8017 RepID=UPI001EAF7A83|nr:hepatocyte nuclear factor 6-like [Oncorhynchus gorbuscha]